MKFQSYSQLGQDLWVVHKTSEKCGGYFVEAGAVDGVSLSNTLLLEREFDWNGICCEPNPEYFQQLTLNRRCKLDNRLLYDADGESHILFAAEHAGGTEQDFQQESTRLKRRLSAPRVPVISVTLNSLLTDHDAPTDIDYISLDTEGSEFRILKGFDFKKWNVSLFSIEHNTQHRNDSSDYIDSISGLLTPHGYKQMMRKMSKHRFYIPIAEQEIPRV